MSFMHFGAIYCRSKLFLQTLEANLGKNDHSNTRQRYFANSCRYECQNKLVLRCKKIDFKLHE